MPFLFLIVLVWIEPFLLDLRYCITTHSSGAGRIAIDRTFGVKQYCSILVNRSYRIHRRSRMVPSIPNVQQTMMAVVLASDNFIEQL